MKRILMSVFVVGSMAAIIAGGTYAYFSDTETSTGNTFSAGTMDLKVADGNEAYTDGVTATWGGTDIKPNDIFSGTVNLKNNGTIPANHVEVSFANTITNVVTPTEIEATDDTDMSDSMNVTVMTYGGTNLLLQSGNNFSNPDVEAADTDNNEIITLKELNGRTLDNLAGLAAAGMSDFVMTVQLDPNTGNGNQGDSVTTVVTFVLNQAASQ